MQPHEPRYYLLEHLNESPSKHKRVNFMFIHFLSFSFKCTLSNYMAQGEITSHTLNNIMATLLCLN